MISGWHATPFKHRANHWHTPWTKNGIYLINGLIAGYSLGDLLFNGDILMLNCLRGSNIAKLHQHLQICIIPYYCNMPPLIYIRTSKQSTSNHINSFSHTKVCDCGLGQLRNLYNINFLKTYMFKGMPHFMALKYFLHNKIGRKSLIKILIIIKFI